MISLIVSTYKPELFAAFSRNVEETIGVEYEIIGISNNAEMGLCEAYNRGIDKARYPYICFSHDDVKFNTQDWGIYIIEQFKQNRELGLLGIAGGGYKPWMPSAWYFSGDQRFRRLNISQTILDTGESVRRIDNPNAKQEIDRVVTLDGCWFCTTKDITNKFRFDNKIFTGYHCYDLDYSLQVGQEYQLAVSFALDIEHFSYGAFEGDWLRDTIKLHEKWKEYLPISSDKLGDDEIRNCEYHAYTFALATAIKYSAKISTLYPILFSRKAIKLIGWKKWISLLKFTVRAILSKK